MIVFDGENLASLTREQNSIIHDQPMHDYLKGKSVKGPGDENGAYRIWPSKTDATAESQVWRDAFARPRQSLPWLILSNAPNGGYEGPLPKTVAEFKALVEKVSVP